MAPKDVIIKFKASTDVAAREKVLDDITKKGGSVVKKDNLDSPIYPYALARMSDDQYSGFQNNLQEHECIEGCELDQEMKTQ